jgi:DMATS type aromatic prenyltransferase
MGGAASSLYEHVSDQLRRLCGAVGLPPNAPLNGLRALVDPIGGRSLAEPPAWPTGVSDDHTPVEYSIACDVGKPPVLRILGETIAGQPSRRANLWAALQLVDTLAARLDLALDRFHRVRQVFLDGDPQHDFAIWFSLVHRPGQEQEVKVYFNPDAQGVKQAPALVAEALRRLHLDRAHAALAARLRPRDRFVFFALDLHNRPSSRIKVYLSHDDADADDIVRAAGAVTGVDGVDVRDFLTLTGCTGPLTNRPPVSGYTFVDADAERPSGYSLYLPIRDYVSDDEQARELVLAVLGRFGLDTSVVDRAITAVARRSLRSGVGLIAHVSLRLTADRAPGVTVYLSSEAYRVSPPRPREVEPVSVRLGGRDDVDGAVPDQGRGADSDTDAGAAAAGVRPGRL